MRNEKSKKMKKLFFATAVATVLIFCGWVTFAAADGFPTVVKTKYGKVEGLLGDNDTVTWKGIPFAKPPVGDLRWKTPDEPDKWGGVKETFDFCEMCSQYNEQATEIIGSEDCLYLNVWRPDTEEKNLPVYFWIHGGGNSIGSASVPMYDGTNLAAKGNFIVVSTNYRLGPLGWFTHPVLRKGEKSDSMSKSGNYGTLDIIMALKWVKKNIKAFGGDPDNVTIAGESAGGMDVISLLISPAASGLFHRAISQSGAMSESPSLEAGDARADEVIDALMAIDGIDQESMKDKEIAAYLRSKTPEELFSQYPAWASGMLDKFPTFFKDGKVINKKGYPEALSSGDYNHVPIILGSNKEEHKIFMLNDLYGPPPYNFESPRMNACEYQGTAEWWDSYFWKPASVDNTANLLKLHQPGEVYAYQFLYGAYNYENNSGECAPTGFNAWPDYSVWGSFPNEALWFGSMHMMEIPFFFGHFIFLNDDLTFQLFIRPAYPSAPPANYPGYELLSDAMIDYVVNFAQTGAPGDAGGVEWDPWSTETGPRILLDANATETLIEMAD
jgi:para-nitrobenzyl esterase